MNLESLNLEYNKLEQLPDDIDNMKSLQVLYLRKNQLKTLPESIGKIPNLRVIELQENPFEKLPKCIDLMQQLTGLYLNGTLIQKAEVEELKELLPYTNIQY